MAGQVLEAAVSGPENVVNLVTGIIHELKVTMFLTGAQNISQFQDRNTVITGKTKEWMDQIME
jgi:isopentenyl-diphosphate delta-isomerase